MSIIVILNFFAVDDDDDDDDYIYIFFSVHQCTVMKTVLFYFNGYAVCVLHVVLKHFRDREIPLSPPGPNFYYFFLLKRNLSDPTTFSLQLISCGPYLLSPHNSSC